MATLATLTSALTKVQADVQVLADANETAAQAELDARNAAVAAATKAGLSVDAGSLPSLGQADAHRRYLTLIALLQDVQSQVDQIGLLTGS